MHQVDLEFQAPNKPLSINVSGHWAKRRRLLTPWHDSAWVHTRNAIAQGRVPWAKDRAAGPVPVTIQAVLPFRGHHRRDPHNYTGTVVKAIVDGIVKAGLVPDDTAEWVTVIDPELVVVPDPHQDLIATIRIRTREN